MIEYENSDLFCQLYVIPKHVVSGANIASWISEITGASASAGQALDEFSSFEVFYDKFSPYAYADNDFVSWPFRVECYPVASDLDPAKEIYKDIISTVISKLRAEYDCKVVAVCRFEDEIISKTGWNWTVNDQEQPKSSI